jgi:uncharacterized protein (TIGR02996 family)
LTRPNPSPRPILQRLLLNAATLLAITLAYTNSFHNGFHFDDMHTIVDNPAIRSLSNIPRFFSDATTFSVLPANRTYRPIVSTSLALDYHLAHGLNPLYFHLTTFVLFLTLILLVQTLFQSILNRTQPSPANLYLSTFAAALFGLHPAMGETVNYIIQRGDLYCTFGCVASLVLFARIASFRRSGLYLLPLVFALLSKPPAAVFPLLLFAFVFFFAPFRDASTPQRLRHSLIAAIPSTVLVALALWLQSAMTPKTFLPSLISPTDYRLTQPYVWLRYLGQFFLPLHLNVDTDLSPIHGLTVPILSGLIFLALLIAAIIATATRPHLYPIAFGLLWFVITQLPTSLYPLSEVENDHRMFFSFPGLILAAVWSAWLLLRQFPNLHRPAILLAPLVLLAYGYGTHLSNRVWLNEETLWRDDILKSPHNGRGLMNHGLTQMAIGAYPAALADFTRALTYTPNYPTLEINLGIVEGAIADQTGNTQTAGIAEAHFQRAITLAPQDDQPHAFYGRWLKDHGRPAEAIAQLQTAIALNPQRPMQRDELIEAQIAAGNIPAALQSARAALTLSPDDPLARETLAHPPIPTAAFWINLSLAQYQHADYTAAATSAQNAITLDPRSPEAWNNLAAANAQLHHWDAAIAAAQQAIILKPTFQLARNNLLWAQTQKRLAH